MQDSDDDGALRALTAPVLNPLPKTVWLLLLAVGGVELVLVLAAQGWVGGPQGIGWRLQAIQRFAFSGEVQAWMLQTGRTPPQHLARYLGHAFVQPGTLHAIFVLAMLAGLGKAIGEGLGAVPLLAAALVPPVLAAVVFGLILGGHELAWLIGGWPMVFGLVGTYTWLLWVRAGGDRARQRRAFGLIGVLMLARLGFGVLGETGHGWIADLTACAIGFGLAAALAPGALSRLRARLRHR
jgi:hypothetical protein